MLIQTEFRSYEDKNIESMYKQNYYCKLCNVVHSFYENIDGQMYTFYAFDDVDSDFAKLMLLECKKQKNFHLEKIKIKM